MRKIPFALLVIAMALPALSESVETKIIVRAKSKDAKFIGSSMGGAFVILKDSMTGELLAKGITTGGTGDTKKIMSEPLKRWSLLSDDSTARFEAVLDVAEPQLITVEVHAPYAQRQSMVMATTQVWLIPGKHIVGDGVLVEIPGFAVDVLVPQAHETIKFVEGKTAVAIEANVVMM